MIWWTIVAGGLIGLLTAEYAGLGMITGGVLGAMMGSWLESVLRKELQRAIGMHLARSGLRSAEDVREARPPAEERPTAAIAAMRDEPEAEPEPELEPQEPLELPEPLAIEPEPEIPAEPEPEPLRAAAKAIPASRITSPVEPEPEPEPEPLPEPEPDQAEAPTPALAAQRAAINFEELFGRRLPIWAGGITLAIAGILIVKYAIDKGIFGRIFTPGVQAISGLLFGLGLIGGAEWAWRQREKVADPRISQALSGAGISTLYAATLVAANLYGLISPLTAFFGLAIVTAAALWLSLRHGIPTALLGLAGGLAAPALTLGFDANVPLLAVYLSFAIAGLVGVARIQRWPWLALIALVGGAGWSLWLIIAGRALQAVGALSIGGFVLLLALALPLFAFSDSARRLGRALAAIVGAAQLGLLVAMGGFQPLNWGLFVLIAAAGQFIAWRDRDLAIVPTIGAALSFILLMLWPDPGHGWLLTFALALGAIHAAPLFVRLWAEPSRLQRAIELAAIAFAAPILALRHIYKLGEASNSAVALSALGGAALVLAAAARGWKAPGRKDDNRLALLLASGGALLCTSAWFALPHWQEPLWAMAVALGLLLLAPRSGDRRIEPLAFAFAMFALFALAWTSIPNRMGEFGAPLGIPFELLGLPSLLRWTGLAAGFAIFAWRASLKALAIPSYVLVTALAYGALAQVVPELTLPIVLAALSAALLLVLERREPPASEALPAMFGGATILVLGITGEFPPGEWARLVGDGPGPTGLVGLLRWGAVAAFGLLAAARARTDALRVLGQFGAAAFAYGALAQVVPGWTLPIVMAAVAATGLFLVSRQDKPLSEVQLLVFGAAACGLLAYSGTNPQAEWLRLIGSGDGSLSGIAFARWAAVALLALFFALRSRLAALRLPGEVMAVLLGYGAAAQVVPPIALPLVAPAALLAGAWWSSARPWPQWRLAGAMLILLVTGWAMLPLGAWLFKALPSLAGIPMLPDDPDLYALAIARRLALPALLLGGSAWLQRERLPQLVREGMMALAGVFLLVSVHIFYRHLFAAAFGTDFAATGLGQRTLWEALLLGAAWLAWKREAQSPALKAAATPLAATAGFHALWYSLLLHNPLWSAQHVGPWPLANLLAPLFLALPLSLYLLAQTSPRLAGPLDKIRQPVLMASVITFAWATLRQAFHGTSLIDPGVSQFEDILRSILGIALAVGFLLWGIRQKRHDWRIASLVLMLVAVAKVFLLDASGLEGLLRIASFVALGFSLIGIGWLYARQLRQGEKEGS